MAGRLAGGRVGPAVAGWLCLLAAAPALSEAAPGPPEISEPSGIGTIVNAEDVHMEAYGYEDSTLGAVHQCTTWQIQEEDTGQPAWQSGTPVAGQPQCVTGVSKNHIHFGDGTFVGPYAGGGKLTPDLDYRLLVTFRNDLGELSPVAEQPFRTASPADVGTARTVPWVATEPGFAVDVIAGGMRLPFDVAMVPNPGAAASSPIAYVAGLYGQIYLVRRDGSLSIFADNLLDFNSSGEFPGGGEFGIGGIAVQPGSGDVFYSTPYFNEAASHFFSKVVRIDTTGDGSTQAGSQTILDMGGVVQPEEPQAASHQISNLSFGPDGNLYLHQGDGFNIPMVEDIDSFYGKILRLDPDTGDPVGGPDGNPHLDVGDGVTARDYVYARGFRNPFGGAWRASNDQLYEVENGPSVDRFARVNYPIASPGNSQSFGYDGSDESMETNAVYNWPKAVAPVGITFVEPQTFGGSGFPAAKQDHAFVAESGPTYATGRQTLGKRISEFAPGPGGEIAGPPSALVSYDGLGKASAVGIAAGPDGLYFTELYPDASASPTDPGARLLRVRYFSPSTACTLVGRKLAINFPPAKPEKTKKTKKNKKKKGKKVKPAPSSQPDTIALAYVGSRIEVNGQWCGATLDNVDRIDVAGGAGSQRLALELGESGFGPGATHEAAGASEIEIDVALGGSAGDQVVVSGGAGNDTIGLSQAGGDLTGDADLDDLRLTGASRLTLEGRGGDDFLFGSLGADLIRGGDGRDRLFGSGGRDTLDGGRGRDRFRGGGGKDRCLVRRGERSSSCELPRRRKGRGK